MGELLVVGRLFNAIFWAWEVKCTVEVEQKTD